MDTGIFMLQTSEVLLIFYLGKSTELLQGVCFRSPQISVIFLESFYDNSIDNTSPHMTLTLV